MLIELPDKCPHEAYSRHAPKCVPGYVYVAKIRDLYKIGYTADTIQARMCTIRHEKRVPVHAIIVFRCHCAPSMEKALHRVFKPKLVMKMTGRREYFRLDEEDLAAIRALTHYGGKELSGESVLTPETIGATREIHNKLREDPM